MLLFFFYAVIFLNSLTIKLVGRFPGCAPWAAMTFSSKSFVSTFPALTHGSLYVHSVQNPSATLQKSDGPSSCLLSNQRGSVPKVAPYSMRLAVFV